MSLHKPVDDDKHRNVVVSKRISIVGLSGSGKSTLAVKLGKVLGLPVCHLDSLFWLPNWTKQDSQVFGRQVVDLTKLDSWIMDGYVADSFETILPLADLVVFLDFDLQFCIDCVRDRLQDNFRVGLPDNLTENKEQIEGLIDYLKNKATQKLDTKIRPLLHQHKDKVIVFETRQQVDSWLYELIITSQIDL